MLRPPVRKTIIAVRLEPKTLKGLDRAAKKHKWSRSETIRAALEAWLEDQEGYVR